jgi:hypothetical protein
MSSPMMGDLGTQGTESMAMDDDPQALGASGRPANMKNPYPSLMRARHDAMAQEKSIYKLGLAVGGAAVGDQLQRSFPLNQELQSGRLASSAISALPLLALPGRRGSGFGNFVTQPAVLGIVGIGIITVLREVFPRGKPLPPIFAGITVVPPVRLAVGSSAKILVDGSDSNASVTFKSSKKATATVDQDGTVKGKKKGPVTITVTGDGKSASIPMTITAK